MKLNKVTLLWLLCIATSTSGWLWSSSSDEESPSSQGRRIEISEDDEDHEGSSIKGVALKDEHLYTGPSFSCDDGQTSLEISAVNDGYCDCHDGTDEPGTSACSGRPKARFLCVNEHYRGYFIPSSRVFDGVCDCCDGSDEPEGLCANTCVEDGIEYRKEKERLKVVQAEGFARKQDYIQRGQAVANQDSKERIAEVDEEIKELQVYKEEITQRIQELEVQKERERKERQKAMRAKRIKGLHLDLLNRTELEHLLIDLVVETATSNTLLDLLRDMLKDKPIQTLMTVEVGADGSVSQEEQEEALYDKIIWVDGDNNNEEEDFDDVDEGEEEEEIEEGEVDENGEADGEQTDGGDEQDKDPLKQARRDLNSLTSKLSKLEREKNDLEKETKFDFGPENEFYVLKGQCFETKVEKYKYTVCPYDKAKQDQTSLGNWEGFVPDSKYRKFKFSGGQRCWNGPQRSLTVALRCGTEEKILDVVEPSMCEYVMNFETPAAC